MIRTSGGFPGKWSWLLTAATGWLPHTARAALTGLKKKGHAVEVLERIRQVGPNKEGARGSFTIYRIAE